MRIIESGHYYRAKGPNRFSEIGWDILQKVKNIGDKTLLFIDDVHSISDVSSVEVDLPTINFSPNPNHLILESGVFGQSEEILDRLKSLRSKSRPRMNGDEIIKWHGFPIKKGKMPMCVLLDAGLTLEKSRLGFNKALNILPYFYKEEQRQLYQIVKRVIPEIEIEVILYDLEGNFWNLLLE